MKLHIEIDDQAPEEPELTLRCRTHNEACLRLERLLATAMQTEHSPPLILTLGDTEYYIPQDHVLFFETDGAGRITAHTAKSLYYTASTLSALERTLPPHFMRVSKSCILNTAAVTSLTHSITGSGEVAFAHTEKRVYISRAYFKVVKEKIHRMHFPTES
ncbi:MAG: LytTR family transcriptional regulator [Clostridia bacterium]|nr:LytTR family transcriptional regulator [Clostridia bacterium]